jgi:MFS family permease
LIQKEKRDVLRLASAQALFQTVSVMMVTASGVVGLELAPSKSLATLPVALSLVGAAIMLIPASLLMRRFGRRAGFLLGASLGCASGMLAAAAIHTHSFWLFAAASLLVGGYSGFAQYYRFAAADVASDAFRSRAISWVVAGGVVAAVAGPNLVRVTQHWNTEEFLATYLAMTVLSIGALLVIGKLSLPPMGAASTGAARPLSIIVRQPVYITALTCSTVGFAVMTMVMTATPIGMLMCGHTMADSTTVIQWHVLGMYLPSFFTGALIRRFGVLRVMAAGIALLGAHVAVAVSGVAFLHFLSGLTLLGVGWNFLYVGGTTLLTEAYLPSERVKAQATHDFLMLAVVSAGSFSAGGLLNHWGWEAVNLTVLPFLVLAAAAVIALALARRPVGTPVQRNAGPV